MKRFTLTVAIIGSLSTFAFSQTAMSPAKMGMTPEQIELAYVAGRNQAGVLSYCQEKGYIDGTAVETQTKLLTLMPVPTDTSKGDTAEKAGKEGMINAMGMNQELGAVAKAKGTTEEAICGSMAEVLKQAAAMLPK